MADLRINWVTPAGQLADLREGDLVNYPLAATETVTLLGDVGQFSVRLDDAVTRAVSLTLGGVETPFQIERDDRLIYWTAPLVAQTQVVVRLTPAINFTLLNGALPPGLSLQQNGAITGTLGNIPTAPMSTRFTVRATNGHYTLDRTFALRVTGRDYAARFNPTQLLPQSREPVHGFTYRGLGQVACGGSFAMTLDIQDQDAVIPPLRIDKVTGFFVGENKFGGVPGDLGIFDLTLRGVIAPDACPGQYFFDITILDETAPSSSRFMIEVLPEVADTIGIIPHVVWDTPAGMLGSIEETEPCYFSVKAHSVKAPEVVYALSPTSSPLPPGITLNQATGRLYGVMPFVNSTTVYSFTIRATAGSVFADRLFSITVLDWYDLARVHHVRLRTRILDDADLVPFYRRTIPSNAIFRSEDVNFGFIKHPYVYMINGLDGSVDLQKALAGQGVKTITNHDYHAQFRLILGEHKVAVARNSQGDVVYEVLYRDLYDPQAKAGGFGIDQGQPKRLNVLWPQSAENDRRYIMPTSVTNMRTDLIMDVGFAMRATAARTQVGTGTHELMPLWMRSAQPTGDIPGFRAVLFLSYLTPGSSAAVLRAINANIKAAVPNGHVYHFDRYFLTVSQDVGGTDQSVHLE
ncbi:MAG: hypothetical protein EOP83_13750 [Verrucomicrobiaceae bacterium]|nr:MAG: hypothetical protein EOP83_13750 [Verrucomicrobiaceae bacterium]